MSVIENGTGEGEMKIAFIADDIRDLNEFGVFHNATFGFMLAAEKFKKKEPSRFNQIKVLLSDSKNLKIKDGKVYSTFDEVEVKQEVGSHLNIIETKEYLLDDLNILFARKDPPFNQSFLAYMEMLTLVPHLDSPYNDKGPVIINNPEGVLRANEKLYAFHFKEFLPTTLITSNKEDADCFFKEHKNIVIKPLFEKGGNGVFHLKDSDKDGAIQKSLSNGEPLILQKYIPEVETGDKRILLFNGEPVAGLLRVPKEGEFLSHISRGAKYQKLELSKRDLEICKALKPYLVKDGLYFTAIDIIGDYLIEINVTCPSNIIEAGECVDRDLAYEFVDWAANKSVGVNKSLV